MNQGMNQGMNEGMGTRQHGAFFVFYLYIIYITNFAPVCIGMVGSGRVGRYKGGVLARTC